MRVFCSGTMTEIDQSDEDALMPSPFPGMDPFIESQRWEPFHASLIPVMQELLVPQVRPRYTVDIEKYVYLVDDDENPGAQVAPDVFVYEQSEERGRPHGAVVATLEPQVLMYPMPPQVEQKYLVLRTREGAEVVTVIELLSPWNKTRPHGIREYLQKRMEYVHAPVSIVELDLLRGGTRLPPVDDVVDAEYFAIVGRAGLRPRAEVYSWTLRDQLPVIPIPLRDSEPDVPLALDEAFNRVYERGGYDYTLKYDHAIAPPLSTDQMQWVRQCLSRWKQDSNA